MVTPAPTTATPSPPVSSGPSGTLERNTFLSPSLNSQKISDSPQVNKWVENYLGIGEWVMDQSVAVLGSSGYFERRR
ncbi:hypothetical protein FQN51_007675 [Onygenales sp. PD_10]|nr:hypothetical protein FQN51_007675 [Onygenales sp. PD_10]